MLTQDSINVLLIGLAVNGFIVLLLIARRFADEWRSRRAVVRSAAMAPSRGSLADAGRPWFDRDLLGDTGGGVSAIGHGPGIVPDLASSATWSTWLDEESARIARYQGTATVVVIELAGLDRLADRIGRNAADRLIPPVAATVRRHARAADRVARLGPARFGVLLVETDEVSAINFIERMRSECDLWLAAGAVSLRLAVGWAQIRSDTTGIAAFHEAERRLFAERRDIDGAGVASADDDARDGFSGVLQQAG